MSAPCAAPDHALEPLLEGIPGAAALFTRDGWLVAANARARGAWAVDRQAPLATQPWGVVLLPLGAEAIAEAERVAAGGGLVERVLPAEGDAPRVTLRVAPVPEALVLVSTSEHGALAACAEAQDTAARLLAGVLAALPVPVRVVNAAGVVVRQNPAAEAELAGRAVDTVRALWELAAPHDLARQRPLSFLDAPAMRALAGMAVVGEPLEVRGGHGTRRMAAHAFPLRDAAGAVTGAVLVDLPLEAQAAPLAATPPASVPPEGTPLGVAPGVAPGGPGAGAALGDHAPADPDAAALDRLVEERSRALLASQEAQSRDRRLAAVGQLAAGVMHDMNNVLNPIMGAAYLLRQHADAPEAVRDYADRIRTAAETGAAIASRVGRFIRQEPLHGGDVVLDLAALAAEVLDFTEPSRRPPAGAGRGVREERALAAGVWVRGIPGEIREALLNLVQNATDAMPDGGTLTVRAWAEGEEACVAVSDTGRGMSAEVRERAFEPFFTTKGAHGSGLGLAEVYGIARRHRGTASIASVPGQGTEVVLRLPRHPEPEAPAPPAGHGAGGGAALRILVVEDQEDSREFLRRILRGQGHAVDAVATCADARAQLRARPGGADRYDLLLADVGLPDGNGWGLVEEARRLCPALRAGVITGWDPNPEREVAAGVAFVLRKPWRLAELQAHVAGAFSPAVDRGSVA